jgi:carboxymethylenebutenolidase
MCNPASNYWPAKSKRAGENVEVPSHDGGKIPVHIARPEGDPPYPTMLIIHDYFDPDDYYFDLAEQYAAAGYLGVAPDFFHRQGDLSEQTHPAAGQRIPAVADDDVFKDVDAVLAYLKDQGLLGSLAITGFCWGGRMSYLLAARHPDTKLLVPFYGHLTAWSGADGNKPYSPLDEADGISAQVVGSYGGGDDSIPLDQVADMEKRLRDQGLQAELKIYAGAPHCFFRTPEWKEASDDSWGRVLSALKETVA